VNIYEALLIFLPWLWGAFEIWLIVRDRIQGKGKTAGDLGTRWINIVSVVVGLTAAGSLNWISAFFFPGRWKPAVFWTGIGVMLLGLALRAWAVATLGAAFRTTIETDENQRVVTKGPYRLVRHPSYGGLLLICCGYGVAVQNWLSLFIGVALPLAALLHRIRLEEAALAEELGPEYRAYQKRTKKLIPWIW
jgi:protein-S-isoprenylcysteine O-methyltransferase Ste14